MAREFPLRLAAQVGSRRERDRHEPLPLGCLSALLGPVRILSVMLRLDTRAALSGAARRWRRRAAHGFATYPMTPSSSA